MRSWSHRCKRERAKSDRVTAYRTIEYMLISGSREKARMLSVLAGACRWTWNQLLAEIDKEYKAHMEGRENLQTQPPKPCLSFFSKKDKEGNIISPGLAARFVALRRETPWLQELPSAVVRWAAKRLADSWKRYLEAPEAVGRPGFHARRGDDSFTIPQDIKIRTDSVTGVTHLSIPVLGDYILRRSGGNPWPEAKPKQVVVKRVMGRWHAFVTYDIGEVEVPDNRLSVGVDRNCGQIAIATGDRCFFTLPVMPDISRLEARLRRYQRQMARRKKGSKRRGVARHRCAKTQRKIAMVRRNWLHHVSKGLGKEFGTIYIEALNVKAMTASAKGTVENPGTNVRAKSALNRSILNTGWAIFEQMLTYKAHRVVRVNPAYTSQTCSNCGHVAKENRKSQSRFECVECGFESNADINAALNIWAWGTGAYGRHRNGGAGPTDAGKRKQACGTRQRDIPKGDAPKPST